MEHNSMPATLSLGLPAMVCGPVDIVRLIREIKAIDEQLLQSQLREPDDDRKLPKTSSLLDQTIELNKLNFLLPDDRTRLSLFLSTTVKSAPLLHISFSADPSPKFTKQLMVWLRREIHPYVLLTIGVQPNIGAGCVVRTTNHYFDFSLRQKLSDKRALLMHALQETR